MGTAVGDVFLHEVGRLVVVVGVEGHIVVDALCLLHRVGEPLGELGRQCPQIGRELQMRQLLLRVKIRLHGVRLHVQRVSIAGRGTVTVHRAKGPVLGKVGLPIRSALGGIFRCNVGRRLGEGIQRNIALCRAGRRER